MKYRLICHATAISMVVAMCESAVGARESAYCRKPEDLKLHNKPAVPKPKFYKSVQRKIVSRFSRARSSKLR
jgi:hypothetical protein